LPDPAPPSSPTSLQTSASPTRLREVARTRVIYGDTDQMGIVYYANYLRYFEIARNEYLRIAGANYRRFEETHGLLLPVVKAYVDYHRPARYDDELAILAAAEAAGAASARFSYQIRRVGSDSGDGEPLVSGYTVHACVTRAGKVVRLPPEMRAALGIS
jgi:acyl-CoA thioester hydrolase